MKIQPIKKVNISDEVSNQIKELIIGGFFELGQKIPSERELCDRFNVSRTSIREALKGLVSTGFLEKKSDGTYVRENLEDILIQPMQMLLTSKRLSISEIFEARYVLEIQNAKLAAVKATEEDICKMQELIDIMEKPDSTLKEVMDSSVEFHNLVAKATKNKILYDMYQVIYSILDTMRDEPTLIKKIDNSLIFHKEIFEKIKARDEAGAGEIMKNHISRLYESYKSNY